MDMTAAMLTELRTQAERVGMLHLGIVNLDHPGLALAGDALREHVAQGRHGEMTFMARTLEVRCDPRSMLDGAQSVLIGVAPYGGQASHVARYAQHADYHTVLHQRLDALATWAHSRFDGLRTRACVDSKPLLERACAALTGKGFIGKNGMFIVPGLGSFTVIGALLTNARWTGEAATWSRTPWDACGSCMRCIDACPTQAFDAPGNLDPRKCISYLTIEHRGEIADALADRMGPWVAGCDECQRVCPYNASEKAAQNIIAHAWLPPLPQMQEMTLAEMATLRSGRYKSWVRHGALRRIPRRTLKRNALIAMGNAVRAPTLEERSALEEARRDDDDLVRAAAQRVYKKRGQD